MPFSGIKVADEERRVQAHCAKKGVIYLSTPFYREASDRLNAMGVPGFKIGSGECNNYPLLDHIAKFGKPMIISTGMNDLASVKKAVDVVKGRVPFGLMHCQKIMWFQCCPALLNTGPPACAVDFTISSSDLPWSEGSFSTKPFSAVTYA